MTFSAAMHLHSCAAILLVCALANTAGAQTLALPEGHELAAADRQPFALSPDGSRLVYVARTTLFVKPVGGGDSVAINGPARVPNKTNPVFSPDGQQILYWVAGASELQRVGITGGTPAVVTRVENPLGLSWSVDGQIFIGAGTRGVLRVPATGGTVIAAIAVANGEAARSPQLLPDGDTVLFTLARGTPVDWAQSEIVVESMRTKQRKVIASGRDARYLASGHLLYVAGTSLVAVRFDPRELVTRGQARSIVDGVRSTPTTGSAQISIALNGTIATLDSRVPPVQMVAVGLDGTRTVLGAVPPPAGTPGSGAPRLSADGKRVSFAGGDTTYVAETANVTAARAVLDVDTSLSVLSPDGLSLAFGTIQRATETIFLKSLEDAMDQEVLIRPGRAPEQWLDGDQGFTFISHRAPNDYDIGLYSVAKREITWLTVVEGSGQLSSALSPDRRWLAYMSDETGDWEVFVQPYPGLNGNGRRYQVTRGGGRSPVWLSPTELIFDNDNRLYTVTLGGAETPTFSVPTPTPITGFIQFFLGRNWDVRRDGGTTQVVMMFRPGPQLNITTWRPE